MSVRMDQQIWPAGFYVVGFLCLVLAVLKLTIEVHWSWWRVLLPLWVLLGHNALYVLVGFICLFLAKEGEESTIVETNFLTGCQLAAMLCFLIFMDNLLRWREGREDSHWFWLFSGKLETVFLFGLFSLVGQLLYWSKIVTELNEQWPER